MRGAQRQGEHPCRQSYPKTAPPSPTTGLEMDQHCILVSPAFGTRADEVALVAALAPSFTVFAYDRRGRGDSGDRAPYAIEREIEDLDAVLDAAGGSVYVFGHSSGAVLALDAARSLPAKITKLALYEPPFIIDASRPPMPEGFAAHLHDLVAAG